MKTLTLENDGSVTVKDGLLGWNHRNAVEASKCLAEFTAAELAAAPAVATLLNAPATQAALTLQRAALVKS